MHAEGGSGTEIVEFFFSTGNLWRWWRRKREREKLRERNVNERESKKSNFFFGFRDRFRR